MHKFLRTIIIAILLVVAGGAGWFAWKAWSVAKAPLVLTLQVNSQSAVEVLQRTPLFFSAFLNSSASGHILRIGRSGEPWYSYLALELVEAEKPAPLKFLLLGKPYSLYFRDNSPGHSASFEMYDGDEAVLDKIRNLYTAELGLSPEQTANIPAGRYTARAVLTAPLRSLWHWHGRVVSNPVAITIQDGTQGTASDQDLNRLTESAEFYLQAGNFQDAYRLALQAKEQQPERIYNYILLGDSLNGLKRDQEALEAYDYALYLRSLQPEYEPPTYLLMRKNEVEERLGARQ